MAEHISNIHVNGDEFKRGRGLDLSEDGDEVICVMIEEIVRVYSIGQGSQRALLKGSRK